MIRINTIANDWLYISVVTTLITNGDEETAEGRLKANALYALCDMNPGQALPTRTLCVELGKMPSLMLRLSLKDPMDLVSNKEIKSFSDNLISFYRHRSRSFRDCCLATIKTPDRGLPSMRAPARRDAMTHFKPSAMSY